MPVRHQLVALQLESAVAQPLHFLEVQLFSQEFEDDGGLDGGGDVQSAVQEAAGSGTAAGSAAVGTRAHEACDAGLPERGRRRC